MTQYIESSAFLKAYLRVPESDAAEELMLDDPDWTTARHTAVEIRRALARDLGGRTLQAMRDQFAQDWARTTVIELDKAVCELAAQIAESTGVRTLDALHVASARQASPAMPILTYDRRLAQAADRLGMTVRGIHG